MSRHAAALALVHGLVLTGLQFAGPVLSSTSVTTPATTTAALIQLGGRPSPLAGSGAR